MFIEEVAERTDRHLEQFCGPRLIAAGLPQGFDDIRFLQIIEVADQINSSVGQIEFGADPPGIVICYMFRQLFGLYL